MRILFISLLYFGLPLWAVIRSPFNVGIVETAKQFAQFVAVQTVIAVLFLMGAVILDRLLSRQWVWKDTVVLHRRSHHTDDDGHVAYVPKTTSQLLHEYWSSEEGKKAYIAWLAHK